jgi:cytidylate kinase
VSRPRVVTIDGAAGSGKSTLARGLARSLALPYVNTGLMYRALTLLACERGADVEDPGALAEVLSGMRFTLDDGTPPELSIDGSPPRAELTSAIVEAAVSQVARHEQVRALMRAEQRRLGIEHGAVMEGRDIGAVVFADAPVKLYLEADADARAHRRASERAHGTGAAAALHDRDRRDMRVNPFEPSEGAVVIDTTELGIAAALEAALAVVGELAPELLEPSV